MASSEYITVPMDIVPTSVALPYPIHVKLADKFVVLRNAGDELIPPRMQQLIQKGVDALYIHNDHWRAFINSLENDLRKLDLDSGSQEAAIGVRNVMYTYWKTVERSRQIDPSIFLQLRELTSKLPAAVRKNRSLADNLIRRYQDPNVYFPNHSINITVYSMAIGMKQGMSDLELQDLALAACVANIGIIRTPKEILYKPSPLTDEEWKLTREHPRNGADLLKVLLVPDLVSQAAVQHHERFDGTGYPNQLRGPQISIFARIISIAEVFNALTSARPWAKPVAPPKAVEMMRQMKGKFDPDILTSTLS